jgi:hypothetical protein
MAYINGGIPSIDSKNMKIGDFDWYNRKFSAYLARNKLHSEYNRKISTSIAKLSTRIYRIYSICNLSIILPV